MAKSISQLKQMNLEQGFGAKIDEIIEHIGADEELDEMIIKLSDKRFDAIMNAYKKKAFKDAQSELKEFLKVYGKSFRDINELYFAQHLIAEISEDVLEQGEFKVPGEKTKYEKAEKGYQDLMLYLVDIDSPHANTLNRIKLNAPKPLPTLDKFIESKKEQARKKLEDYSKAKYTKERFDRIFSYVKKEIKSLYSDFKKDEARRVKKNEPLLSTNQKINIVRKRMNNVTEQMKATKHGIDNRIKAKATHAALMKHRHYIGTYKFSEEAI